MLCNPGSRVLVNIYITVCYRPIRYVVLSRSRMLTDRICDGIVQAYRRIVRCASGSWVLANEIYNVAQTYPGTLCCLGQKCLLTNCML